MTRDERQTNKQVQKKIFINFSSSWLISFSASRTITNLFLIDDKSQFSIAGIIDNQHHNLNAGKAKIHGRFCLIGNLRLRHTRAWANYWWKWQTQIKLKMERFVCKLRKIGSNRILKTLFSLKMFTVLTLHVVDYVHKIFMQNHQHQRVKQSTYLLFKS